MKFAQEKSLMTTSNTLNQLHETIKQLQVKTPSFVEVIHRAFDEITVETNRTQLKPFMLYLRDDKALQLNQLIDLCAVDYLNYGIYDWETQSATDRGFSRAVERKESIAPESFQTLRHKPRFAVVYHLLSTQHNHRLRVRVFLEENDLIIPSVDDIWKSANWYEREAYDLYGILFADHPDLRRLLTDYGFIGHPFRKDFPLSGHVEMRYDASLQKVIYEPVDIEPRVSTPKVIREDNRYNLEEEKQG